MAYSHTTLDEATDSVALRLADSSFVRFAADEIQLAIIEALRTFSCLTGMWQSTETETIAAGTQFIDLPSVFSASRGYSVTDRDLIGLIQYHLWEPKSPSVWIGSEMFVMADLTESIQHRRDQFLLETSCRITRHNPIPTVGLIDPGTEDLTLDQSVMAVRRVVWIDSSTADAYLVWPSSNAAMRAANPLWPISGSDLSVIPRQYLYNERAPFVLQFGPPPSASGTLDLLTVDAGAAIDPSAGVLLGIPDDFSWVIKYGAMADLYAKDGPARDYARSLYCERRYQMGVAAAQSAQSIVDGRVSGVPVQFSSLQGLDQYAINWQSRPAPSSYQQTFVLAPVGLNLCAISPPPRIDVPVRLDLIRNVPIPASGGEYLQIGKEYLDTILGEAVHILMLKVGGEEFAATTHLNEAMINASVDFNDRLKNNSAFERARVGDSDPEPKRAAKRGIRRVTGGSVQESVAEPRSQS